MEVSPKKNKYNWDGKTILIVEDDTASAMFMEAILKRTGVKLFFAEDGFEAVELCKNNEEIELVLMDVQLPNLSGYEATKKIKEFRPNIDVIVQTANVFADERDKAMTAGCTDYISKPINKEKLFEQINNIFKKNSKN